MQPERFPLHAVIIVSIIFPLAILSIFIGGLASTFFHIATGVALAAYLIPDLTRVANWFYPLPEIPQEPEDEPDPR